VVVVDEEIMQSLVQVEQVVAVVQAQGEQTLEVAEAMKAQAVQEL
jgi:hypothetical protein